MARGDYLLDMSSRHQDMEEIEAGLRPRLTALIYEEAEQVGRKLVNN